MKNKIFLSAILICLLMSSCEKDPEIKNSSNLISSITINYNNDQEYNITNIPDSCLTYDTKKHIVWVSTYVNPFNTWVSMRIFIDLDSISYPFSFPKKNIISSDYYNAPPLTESQCARIDFCKIVPPDASMVSDFLMISADNVANVNLTNYSNNYLTGNFNGISYCYHKINGQIIPTDLWPLLGSITINSANFNFKLTRK